MSLGLVLLLSGHLRAQDFFEAPSERPPALRLSAQELNFILKVAKEPLMALREGRAVRPLEVTSFPRALNQSAPLAVTLWLDHQILARAFEIRQPQPIVLGILALAQKVLEQPDQGRLPTMEEWPRLKVGVAVLHGLLEAESDQEVGSGQAVVVLEGFTIGLGLPKDMPGKYENSELLAKACQMAGLRPNSWLLPEKVTIFAALVDEMVE
ncbi:MAG: hypothetical protein LBE80_11065 [Deltaproteobacteria bacterium]|jgi:hypothetical protein|nr:hypothetical protein [Deltaproteobacteria bacterium]